MFAHAMSYSLNIGAVTVKTTAGDVTMANEGAVVVTKVSGVATQVTLPPNPGADGTRPFRWIIDGKGDAAANNITVVAPSAGTINGASSYVLSENYATALFFWNGTEWNVLTPPSVSSAEIGFINGVTPGTAAASKAVVLDANSSIATINSATMTTALAAALTLNDVATLAAAGTVIANAAVIAHTVTIVTGADDAKGVVMPTASAGKVMAVYSNQATNGLKVYPPVNGTINDGTANTAIVIEGKTMALLVGMNATNWGAIFTVNA